MKKIMRYIDRYQLHGLISHVQVKDFMSCPVITLRKTARMSDAREMMRRKRFSGLPIVDSEKKLVGIISIEDIVMALAEGTIEDQVWKHMSKKIVSVNQNDDMDKLMETFADHTYNRLPVIDDDGRVVGIITKGDMGNGLSLHLLHRIEALYEHNQRRKALLEMDVKERGLEYDSSKNYFFYPIDIPDVERAGEGSLLFKEYVKKRELPDELVKRASISLYEAEVNVVIHAGGKGTIRAYLTDTALFLFVADEGTGIADIDLAMQEGFSTASDEVREYGFGAGMGLPNMSRFSDKLIVLSDTNGTKVEMMFYFNSDGDFNGEGME